MWPYMMGGFGNGCDWTWSVFMIQFWGLFRLLLIFAIVAGVVLLVQAFAGFGVVRKAPRWMYSTSAMLVGKLEGMSTWKDATTWNNSASPFAEAGPDALPTGGAAVDSLSRSAL